MRRPSDYRLQTWRGAGEGNFPVVKALLQRAFERPHPGTSRQTRGARETQGSTTANSKKRPLGLVNAEREHLRDWPEGPWDLDGKVNGTALAEGHLADAPEMRALKMYVLLDEETEFQESIHKFIAFLSFSDLLQAFAGRTTSQTCRFLSRAVSGVASLSPPPTPGAGWPRSLRLWRLRASALPAALSRVRTPSSAPPLIALP